MVSPVSGFLGLLFYIFQLFTKRFIPPAKANLGVVLPENNFSITVCINFVVPTDFPIC